MCTSNSHGRIDVSAPARVLEIRRYRTRRGGRRMIVVVEVRKFARDRHLRTVLKAVGPSGIALKSVRGAVPLRNQTLIYRLGQLWPTS